MRHDDVAHALLDARRRPRRRSRRGRGARSRAAGRGARSSAAPRASRAGRRRPRPTTGDRLDRAPQRAQLVLHLGPGRQLGARLRVGAPGGLVLGVDRREPHRARALARGDLDRQRVHPADRAVERDARRAPGCRGRRPGRPPPARRSGRSATSARSPPGRPPRSGARARRRRCGARSRRARCGGAGRTPPRTSSRASSGWRVHAAPFVGITSRSCSRSACAARPRPRGRCAARRPAPRASPTRPPSPRCAARRAGGCLRAAGPRSPRRRSSSVWSMSSRSQSANAERLARRQRLLDGRGEPLHEDAARELAPRGLAGLRPQVGDGMPSGAIICANSSPPAPETSAGVRIPRPGTGAQQRDIGERGAGRRDHRRHFPLQRRGGRVEVGEELSAPQLGGRHARRVDRGRGGIDAQRRRRRRAPPRASSPKSSTPSTPRTAGS